MNTYFTYILAFLLFGHTASLKLGSLGGSRIEVCRFYLYICGQLFC